MRSPTGRSIRGTGGSSASWLGGVSGTDLTTYAKRSRRACHYQFVIAITPALRCNKKTWPSQLETTSFEPLGARIEAASSALSRGKRVVAKG